MAERPPNRYLQLIERIFLANYREGAREVAFTRQELIATASDLGIRLPSNIGDVVYSFRYRTDLPEAVVSKAPGGEEWIILPEGRGRYRFVATSFSTILPTRGLAETKVPEATPGIITMHAMSDEQALLAKLRYNRLIDIFTGVTCYSLQSHLRTTVRRMGQVETDEIYIGVDRRGRSMCFQSRRREGAYRLSVVQILQDIEVGSEKFPNLICRPIAAQFMGGDSIALFDFEMTPTGLALANERHYRLVPPEQMTSDDLAKYRERPVQQV
jgi:hypothetical protein